MLTYIKTFGCSFKVFNIEHLKDYKGLNSNDSLKFFMIEELVIKKHGKDISVDSVPTTPSVVFKMVEDFLGVHAIYDSKLEGSKDVIMLSLISTMDRHGKENRECDKDNCFIHRLANRYGIKKDEDGNFPVKEIEKAVDNEIKLEIIGE